jgi:hypothetical protein
MNAKNNSQSLVSAVMDFVNEALFQKHIQDLPHDLQELFELLLETEQANDQRVRLKILKCLSTARGLNKACSEANS